jgi:hypothetical protein
MSCAAPGGSGIPGSWTTTRNRQRTTPMRCSGLHPLSQTRPPPRKLLKHSLRRCGSFIVVGDQRLSDRVDFQRLTQWFSNRASATNAGSRRDSQGWFPLLQRLHQLRNTRPRRRTPVQQFMQDYSKEVKEAFAKQYGGRKDLTSGQRLNFQQEVARALLHSEYSSLIPVRNMVFLNFL